MTTSAHTWGRLGVTCVAALIACTDSAVEERRWFARELERTLGTDVEAQAVRIDSVDSQAVPGLTFLRGILFDRSQIDAEFFAVNAAVLEDGRREALATVSDLSSFLSAAGKLPQADRTILCAEAVAFAGPRSNNEPIPAAYMGGLPFRDFVEGLGGFMEPALDTVAFQGPEFRPESDSLTVVRMWVVEPDQLTEYQCTVTDSSVGIEEIRSLVGGGFRVSA